MQDIYDRLYAIEEQLSGFYEKLDHYGLEWFKRFYGVYRGEVMDNKDPEKRGRILACVPEVGHTTEIFPEIWIDPVFAAAGDDRGSFCPPEVGDSVRVVFTSGDAGTPIAYFGGWFGQDELPKELTYSANGYPERRGFVSRMGHAIWVSDEKDKEEIQVFWHKADAGDAAAKDDGRDTSADRTSGKSSTLAFTSDGSITATNQQGSLVAIDATNKQIKILEKDNENTIVMDKNGFVFSDKNGNSITLNKDNTVTISGDFTVKGANGNLNLSGNIAIGAGASFSVVLGEKLIQYLATHVHPTGVGPSGPPTPPPTPDLLSQTVKVKP
jgi:hypothetical protein